MTIKLGPILGFRGSQNNKWNISILVVTDTGAKPAFTCKDTTCKIKQMATLNNHFIWRYDFAISQKNIQQKITYHLAGDVYSFAIPGKLQSPRMAYVSCNGFSNLKDMKQVRYKNFLWQRPKDSSQSLPGVSISESHEMFPFHLLLMGGDQIYSDTMWQQVKSLNKWSQEPYEKKITASFTKTMQEELTEFYFKLYCDRWSQSEPAHVMAQIPTLMMWDDHDIFDGYGSYRPELQQCPVYQGIFTVARYFFRLFQLQCGENEVLPGSTPTATNFSYGYVINKQVGILSLDLRSDRTVEQVMTLGNWDAVFQQLGTKEFSNITHLFVLLSIPVVHPKLTAIEDIFDIIPGQQDLEDDLKDQWLSRGHQEERVRLIYRFLDHAEKNNCRVTFLSGDVHVAGLGLISSSRSVTEKNAQIINQLTSSAIVHPAPSWPVQYFLNQLSKVVETIDRGIVAHMQPFPGSTRCLLAARNWLSLMPDDLDGNNQNRYWANWHVEGEERSYKKVIHPVGV